MGISWATEEGGSERTYQSHIVQEGRILRQDISDLLSAHGPGSPLSMASWDPEPEEGQDGRPPSGPAVTFGAHIYPQGGGEDLVTPLGGVGFSQYVDMQQGAAGPSSARPRGTTNRGYASSDLYNSTRPRHANERIHRRPQQSTGEAIFGTPRGMAPRFSGNEPNTENPAFRASTPLDSQSEGENLYDYNWENRDAGAAGGDWQQAAGAHFGRPGGLGGGGRPKVAVDHTGGANGAFGGTQSINTLTDLSAVTAGSRGTVRWLPRGQPPRRIPGRSPRWPPRGRRR